MATHVAPNVAAPRFPSGESRPIAVLLAEPDDLAARHGLRFAAGQDDLDDFRFAVLDLGGDLQASLVRHWGDPNPGTVVRVDATADAEAAFRRLEAALNLTGADILWRTGESEASAS